MSAAGIVCKRGGAALGRSGLSALMGRSAHSLLSSDSASFLEFSCSQMSQRYVSQFIKTNGKKAFLVDTLALVRRLEAQGVLLKYAEAITSAIAEVLNDSVENMAQSLVSKGEMQKTEIIQASDLSKFKYEVQSSQEHHFSLMKRETEKLESELRHEMDKVTTGLRVEIHELKAKLEAAKVHVIKYCVVTLISISAAGLAIARFF